jgi:hypothetical protein
MTDPRPRLTLSRLLVLGLLASGALACSSGSTVSPGEDVSDASLQEIDDAQGDATGTPEVGLGVCEIGATECVDEAHVRVCTAKGVWTEFPCSEDTICVEGECVAWTCTPNALSCDGHSVVICLPDGSGMELYRVCEADQTCIAGTCVDAVCEPGIVACAGAVVLICAEDGLSWQEDPCEEDSVCFEGSCLECVFDEHCPEGTACESGACVLPALTILTQVLPPATMGVAYEVALEASGGDGEYTWSLLGDGAPDGISLSEDGVLSGTTDQTGDFVLEVQVIDGADDDARDLTLSVIGLGQELVITTGSPLPKGTEGEPYSVSLNAESGEPPYGWFINGGALPLGLDLLSSGEITGVPAEIGPFEFTVKVVDDALPVGYATKTFEIEIEVAPLEILGDTAYDLWIVKIIILPMITVIEGIPIPYNQQLQAKGGLKPYHWTEYDIPGIDWLLPKAGIPQGLSLADDGSLSGSVTDPDEVMALNIPFTEISLTGFFFGARVEDSQSPTDSATALFLIPTVPIAW